MNVSSSSAAAAESVCPSAARLARTLSSGSGCRDSQPNHQSASWSCGKRPMLSFSGSRGSGGKCAGPARSAASRLGPGAGTAQSRSSSALENRPAWLRSALARVSNQSAISSSCVPTKILRIFRHSAENGLRHASPLCYFMHCTSYYSESMHVRRNRKCSRRVLQEFDLICEVDAQSPCAR